MTLDNLEKSQNQNQLNSRRNLFFVFCVDSGEIVTQGSADKSDQKRFIKTLAGCSNGTYEIMEAKDLSGARKSVRKLLNDRAVDKLPSRDKHEIYWILDLAKLDLYLDSSKSIESKIHHIAKFTGEPFEALTAVNWLKENATRHLDKNPDDYVVSTGYELRTAIEKILGENEVKKRVQTHFTEEHLDFLKFYRETERRSYQGIKPLSDTVSVDEKNLVESLYIRALSLFSKPVDSLHLKRVISEANREELEAIIDRYSDHIKNYKKKREACRRESVNEQFVRQLDGLETRFAEKKSFR
ncbi:MAG: hypothetical protein ACFFD4_19770 [Candidatus Odinarchaeota archaeon]